jgi:UDP-glucose 4-epimerase
MGLLYQGIDIDEFNIYDNNSVMSYIKQTNPDIVLNCAAYLLADKAESSPEEAFAVNTIGPFNLAMACELFEENRDINIISNSPLTKGRKQAKPARGVVCLFEYIGKL